jgi:hypothetical protein
MLTGMDAPDELDAVLARLPQQTPAQMYAELQEARRAAETAPWPEPSIIPMPTYPDDVRGLLGGTMRFGCPLGCDWHHDEHPGRDAALEPLVLPLDPDQFEETLTAQANDRAEAFRARVEAAIVDHFEQAHPGR